MKAFYNKNIDPIPANEMNRYILEGGFPRTIQLEHMADKLFESFDGCKNFI